MRKFFRWFPTVLFLAVVAVSPLFGEVYLLRPFVSGKGGATSLEGMPGLGKTLRSERIEVNGLNLTLDISMANAPAESVVDFLVSHFSAENLQYSDGVARLAFKRADGQVERVLLVFGGKDKPITVFRVVSPEVLPPPSSWPTELPPLPENAVPRQVIRFKATGAVYGAFAAATGDPVVNFRRMASQLRAQNWQAAGNEAAPAIGGNGDIFISAQPPRIMWVSFGAEGCGAYFTRNR